MTKIGMIFDLDGTLADTLDYCVLSFQDSYEKITGIRPTYEKVIAYFGVSEEGIAQSLLPEKSELFVNTYMQVYSEYLKSCGGLFDGIIDILDILKTKNIKISMVTGKGAQSAEITLDKFGIKHYFEHVETGSMQGSIKPKCIDKIVKNWDLSKENIYYVGDQPSDIRDSKLAGVKPIAVSWAKTSYYDLLKQHQPHLLFSEISAFRNWILTL